MQPQMRYTSLTKALADHANVSELKLRGSCLRALPSDIRRLEHLEILDVSQTQITTLPDEIGDLRRLRVLSCSECWGLKTVPDALVRLTSLEEFNLWGTHITNLPDLSGLSQLHTLNLGAIRSLASVPATCASLPSLRHLNVYGHSVEAIPAAIFGLAGLQELEVGDDALDELPEDVGDLRGLRRLSVYASHLQTLPRAIARLTALEDIDVSLSHRLDLSSVFPLLAALPRLRTLALGGSFPMKKQFREIPRGIGSLRQLRQLNVQGNDLQELPPDVFDLVELTELNFSQNILRAIPAEIGKLRHLRKLDLKFNRYNPYIADSVNIDLTQLFAQADKLANLRELDLRYLSLETLPDEIGRLTHLKILHLGHEFPQRERARIQQLLPRTSVKF